MIDVWGEGSQGIVELEADPITLALAIAFLKAHWLFITIAGVMLYAIVTAIIIQVKIAQAPALPIAAIALIGGLALVGLVIYQRRGT